MHLLPAVEFSKKLSWLAQTKVISLKTQLQAENATAGSKRTHAENACRNAALPFQIINVRKG